MRHTRKRQLYNFQKKRNVVFVNFEMNHWNSIEASLDMSFKWHSESVSSNFWSNWRKSCVSFNYKSSHPNAVGMATKYLPTKERN
ncbi:hypothetical protein MYW48_25860 [Bacillus cereus]|uniref:hypothetical protein n=1 Tax=Bacillus cereus TaxID=1396 RepID=UPI001FFD6C57|nr:hypothetical protein [Bacillus cereus]UPJ16070.1 hypothetical protein MYW48_25860 [Bacillus cereus]